MWQELLNTFPPAGYMAYWAVYGVVLFSLYCCFWAWCLR